MSPPDVLIVAPQHPVFMEALEREYRANSLWLQDDPGAFLRTQGQQIRALVTSFAHGADGTLINALPNLEIIASYGVGIDRVDLAAVRARGLVLTNTPDINEPVADTAMALLLATTRRVCEADRFVRAGQWGKTPFPFGVGLAGKTCGIVGLGRIGRSVAKRAEAFGLNIAYYGPHHKPDVPYRYYDDLHALAEASDFLILALPGGEETRNIINADILSALGPQGFLINVARGSVVDEKTLIQALQSGQIAGAGLDVFETEPLTQSPLMSMDNVVLLPHIASATVETRTEMCHVVMANLKAHFEGRPVLNPVMETVRDEATLGK